MPEGRATLSVVMPTRNQAAFIHSAVRSVLDQAEVLELVVADGGSTDGTQAILQELASAYPGRLHWVSEGDAGPADAVNKAVGRTRGSVIGWLNSDDLYTLGAATRALRAFDERPDLVLVYGEGEHIDSHGASLGRYPTLSPQTPLAAWADGCPVCQPTAFFRRDCFVGLGGLDTGLRTAFDYEFWLRVWKAHPGQIGFVPEVQALSRLHAAGITLRMREQVALEGLQVVHRHIGPAPVHWLLTHAGEALVRCPFEAAPDAVRAHLLGLAEQARVWLVPDGVAEFRKHLAAHRGWQLARADFVADVHADGWAPPELALRLKQPAGPPYRRLRVWGRHASPQRNPLRLSLLDCSGTPLWQGGVSAAGAFNLMLPLPPKPDAALPLTLRCDTPFVPAAIDPRSSDRRALAFQLDAIELLA
ncbi:MAG TPA: glycosyltransferase family 2 protein [Burkholderiaceae bacterium]